MKTTQIIPWLLLSTLAPMRGDESVLPWKMNQPLVTVQKEVYKKHPRKEAAALVAVRYVGPKFERLETHSVEFRDDVHSERFCRFSSDNGKTWSPSRPPTLITKAKNSRNQAGPNSTTGKPTCLSASG